MKRLDQQCGSYRIRGVDDWLVFVMNAAGEWGYFATECDPAWREVPGDPSVFTADGCIAVARDMIARGARPDPIDPDCLADTIQHFGEAELAL